MVEAQSHCPGARLGIAPPWSWRKVSPCGLRRASSTTPSASFFAVLDSLSESTAPKVTLTHNVLCWLEGRWPHVRRRPPIAGFLAACSHQLRHSYNRYLAIAARVVRRSLKDDIRVQAERRGEMDIKFAKWQVSRRRAVLLSEGRGLTGGAQHRAASRARARTWAQRTHKRWRSTRDLDLLHRHGHGRGMRRSVSDRRGRLPWLSSGFLYIKSAAPRTELSADTRA